MSDPGSSLWATLIPVIVGGVIGLAGGFLGPWFVESQKQSHEKKRKRAEKLEELVAALHEHEHWLEASRNYWMLDLGETPGLSPLGKATAIVAVYFQNFESGIQEIENLARDYEKWMVGAGKKKRLGQANYDEGFEAAFGAYWAKLKLIVKELADYAQRDLL